VIVRDAKLELVKVSERITLEYLQSIVQGYIEIVDTFVAGDMELHVFGNEEGKLIGMPLNVMRRDGEPLCGPLIICSGDQASGDTLPLTLDEAQRVKILRVKGHAPTLFVNDRP
jgi:hypothetical protein